MEIVYRAEHVHRALATDPRVGPGEWDVCVTSTGRGVVVGQVASPAQRRAIDEVLAGLPEAAGFLNRTRLRVLGAPGPAEPIARGPA